MSQEDEVSWLDPENMFAESEESSGQLVWVTSADGKITYAHANDEDKELLFEGIRHAQLRNPPSMKRETAIQSLQLIRALGLEYSKVGFDGSEIVSQAEDALRVHREAFEAWRSKAVISFATIDSIAFKDAKEGTELPQRLRTNSEVLDSKLQGIWDDYVAARSAGPEVRHTHVHMRIRMGPEDCRWVVEELETNPSGEIRPPGEPLTSQEGEA